MKYFREEQYTKDWVSNSWLSRLKILMQNRRPYDGEEQYYIFGNELHKRYLEPHKQIKVLSQTEEEHMKNMLEVLHQDAFLSSIYTKSKKEQRFKNLYRGVFCKGITDEKVEVEDLGLDLKTTTATSFKGFLQASIQYDYFRQSQMYSKADNLKTFIIAGIQKRPPYKIFILDTSLYPVQMRDGLEELHFLIDIAKRYFPHLIQE